MKRKMTKRTILKEAVESRSGRRSANPSAGGLHRCRARLQVIHRGTGPQSKRRAGEYLGRRQSARHETILSQGRPAVGFRVRRRGAVPLSMQSTPTRSRDLRPCRPETAAPETKAEDQACCLRRYRHQQHLQGSYREWRKEMKLAMDADDRPKISLWVSHISGTRAHRHVRKSFRANNAVQGILKSMIGKDMTKMTPSGIL